MVQSAQEIGKEVIERIVEGNMDSQPAVKFYMDRAIITGDYAALIEFLNNHPVIMAQAESNIALINHQKNQNPFRPYPSREKAKTELSGPLTLGYINEFDDKFGIKPDDLCMLAMIFGRVGVGKSQIGKILLCQILRSVQFYNILCFDIKHEYHFLLPYAKHLKVLLPKMIKINPLQVPEWITPKEYANLIGKIFIREDWLGTTSENEIIKLIVDLYQQRGIFENGKNYPTMTYIMKSQKD